MTNKEEAKKNVIKVSSSDIARTMAKDEKPQCPECLKEVEQGELDMFGGLCEDCNEHPDDYAIIEWQPAPEPPLNHMSPGQDDHAQWLTDKSEGTVQAIIKLNI